ncbi:ImuA family protein [Maricaulis sp. CAU 1757]
MRAVPAPTTGRSQLDELRRQIKALEGRDASVAPASGGAADGGAAQAHSPFETSGRGAAARLPQIASGLHETCPASYLDTPAALLFQTALMAVHARRCETPRPLVWVVPPAGAPEQDFGRPYPPALRAFGLDPDSVLLVEAGDPGQALWAMEEGLRAGAWVVGETGRSARYDLTASKRLDRAARARDSLVLVLRSHDGVVPSAARTRWRIAARPSAAQAWMGASGLPGLGPPRFHAALERMRGDRPRDFEIEWKNETLHVLEPAPVADRAAASTSRPGQGTGGATLHRLGRTG